MSKKNAQISQSIEVAPPVDMLDIALGSNGSFDAEPGSGVAVSAKPSDHVPTPHTGDDEEAPSPDDLGRAWLSHATEAEHSPSAGELIPDVNDLPVASDELAEAAVDEPGEDGEDGQDLDETTAEYVRRHRISLMG